MTGGQADYGVGSESRGLVMAIVRVRDSVYAAIVEGLGRMVADYEREHPHDARGAAGMHLCAVDPVAIELARATGRDVDAIRQAVYDATARARRGRLQCRIARDSRGEVLG